MVLKPNLYFYSFRGGLSRIDSDIVVCDHDVSFLLFPYLIFLKVIGAASKEKLDVVKSMGASAVIDYNTDSIKEKVWSKSGCV